MDQKNLQSILELINLGIRLGGELVPVALRAYAAIKAESGMSDEELTAISRSLNDKDADKLQQLIGETQG